MGIILLLGLIGSCIGIFANTDDETDQDSKNKNIIEEPEEKPLDEEKEPVENESEAEPDQQEEIIEPEPKPEPETETEEISEPDPEPIEEPEETVIYKNCSEVRAAGAAPIRKGEPGYSSKLDRDGDGIACDQ